MPTRFDLPPAAAAQDGRITFPPDAPKRINTLGSSTGSYVEQQFDHIHRALAYFDTLLENLAMRTAMVSVVNQPEPDPYAEVRNMEPTPEPSPATPLDEQLHSVRRATQDRLDRLNRLISNIQV